MKKYYEKLEILKQISAKLDKLMDDKADDIEGTISFSKRKNGYQYYIYHPDKSRTYIKKTDLDVIKNMAQQEYYRNLKDELEKQKKLLEQFLDNYHELALKEVYENRSHAKRILIEPLIQPDEQYIEQWMQQHPENQNPFPEKGKYKTERGEYVRSKSEKILADLFYKYNIPYQYEPAIKLKNGKTIYPDFVLLNVKERKTIYWEHLGLASDVDYASKNLEKLNIYEKNGIMLGTDLVVSMETEFLPLDIKLIEEKIKWYLN